VPGEGLTYVQPTCEGKEGSFCIIVVHLHVSELRSWDLLIARLHVLTSVAVLIELCTSTPATDLWSLFPAHLVPLGPGHLQINSPELCSRSITACIL